MSSVENLNSASNNGSVVC